MNTFKMLGGLVLLLSVIPFGAGQNEVTVTCSRDWFQVTVDPFLLNSDVYVHFSEVHLGNYCPPNRVEPYMYQFTYLVTECGIRAKVVSQDLVIYSTEVYYQTSPKYVISVSCAAPQKSPWLPIPKPVRAARATRTTSQTKGASTQVFDSPESSQTPTCDCPPFVFGREEGASAASSEVAMQVALPEQSPYAAYFLTDWDLRSDDLLGPM
ncbi:PREDICTED: placenta-specific protein 1 [Elephantulus edwardii]|uniref:placenta-specific protein 1 n=1 Tax=Elephantulus edwardii TaxID=28737 RepID=UPI0003F063B4|nr:PREDICTED: placenta-specific protein 1 [Elephantulus edwardii]